MQRRAKGNVIPAKLPLGVKLVNSVSENKKIITSLIAKYPGDMHAIRKKIGFLRAVWAKKPGGKEQVTDLLHHFDEMVKNIEETGVKQNIKKKKAMQRMSSLQKSAAYKSVDMAAQPIKLEDRPYSWKEFQKSVKGKSFFDPKSFDEMEFSHLGDKVQKRIWSKWNARFPISAIQMVEDQERGIRTSEEKMSKVKKTLLERAAENAYQNGDIRLAGAFYDEIEKVAKGAYDPKPAEEGKCGPEGCIQPAKDGKGYWIISNKTGKPWGPASNPNTYKSEASAKKVLEAYHGSKGF